MKDYYIINAKSILRGVFVVGTTILTKAKPIPLKDHDMPHEDTNPGKHLIRELRENESCEDSPQGWYDRDGPTFDCTWYAFSNRCDRFGNGYENFGKVANQACCACGGGARNDQYPSSVPAQAHFPSDLPTSFPTPTSSPNIAPNYLLDSNINVKYYDFDLVNLSSQGLDSYTPYKVDTVATINFPDTNGDFATSGKIDYVAALFVLYFFYVRKVANNSIWHTSFHRPVTDNYDGNNVIDERSSAVEQRLRIEKQLVIRRVLLGTNNSIRSIVSYNGNKNTSSTERQDMALPDHTYVADTSASSQLDLESNQSIRCATAPKRQPRNIFSHFIQSFRSNNENENCCEICLTDYKVGEEVAFSPNEECPHGFHKKCIVDWLIKNESCPICRRDYLVINAADQNVQSQTTSSRSNVPPPYNPGASNTESFPVTELSSPPLAIATEVIMPPLPSNSNTINNPSVGDNIGEHRDEITMEV